MPLTACWDASAADWIATSALPWTRLVTFGPAGFAAYARLRYLPDPAYQGQPEADAEVDEDWCGHDQLATLMQVLAAHTRRPDDCYVCVWEGYTADPGRGERDRTPGDMPLWYRDGSSPEQGAPARGWHPAPAARPGLNPARPRSRAPVVVPNRAYFLFHGSLADVYDWGGNDYRGPTEMWAGQTRLHSPHPAFVWPADHAWCVAGDVDAHWAGIGADPHVIDQLVRDERLDVVPADPDAEQPAYH